MSESQNKTTEKISDEKWVSLLHVLELFRRYFANEANARERNSIDTWEPIENEKQLLSDKTLKKECDTTLVWNAVSTELKFNINRGQKRFHIRNIHRYAAAAVLFILLGGGILFFTQNKIFNSSEYGVMADANTFFQTTDVQTKQVTLPDGSRIHLNRGTKISYASNAFNHKQREVWLSGEAFFEVAKNPEKPFIIHTGDMTTTVKGTSFNVKAYSELSEQVVSVRTGKVKVTKADGQFVQITPDQKAIFNKITNVLTSGVTDGELAASWRSGNIVFDHADHDEIRLRIRQEFGKEVIIQNNVLSDAHFIASYPAQTNLERIVKTIALTNGVQYSINESQVIFK